MNQAFAVPSGVWPVRMTPGPRTATALPIDAVLFFRFAVALCVVAVQIQAGGGERRVAEIVAHEAQVEVAVGHVRTRAVAQPVRGSALELRRACGILVATQSQPVRRAREDTFHDRVQRRSASP